MLDIEFKKNELQSKAVIYMMKNIELEEKIKNFRHDFSENMKAAYTPRPNLKEYLKLI